MSCNYYITPSVPEEFVSDCKTRMSCLTASQVFDLPLSANAAGRSLLDSVFYLCDYFVVLVAVHRGVRLPGRLRGHLARDVLLLGPGFAHPLHQGQAAPQDPGNEGQADRVGATSYTSHPPRKSIYVNRVNVTRLAQFWNSREGGYQGSYSRSSRLPPVI